MKNLKDIDKKQKTSYNANKSSWIIMYKEDFMNNKITTKINVKDNLIGIMRVGNKDYISLTDLAKYKNESNPGDVIIKWMSNKSSFDFYCLWEDLYDKCKRFCK